jgi:hypothetical protein
MEKFGGTIKLAFSYSDCKGPRSDAAGVQLSLSVSDEYEFVNAARWPEENYGHVVERGVRDALRDVGYDPDLGVRVVLKGVEWDSVNSSEHSFYMAARGVAWALAGVRNKRPPKED